jgi:LPS-assembly protein
VLATLAETPWQGLYYSGFAEYVRFQQPGVIDGGRGVLFPQVAWKRGGPAWYFTGRGSVHLRQYDLSDSPTPVAGDTTPGYAIPIGSVDAGMVFERDWEAFGTPFVQTLEPRAFYVYIPYRDQSAAPVFDTALDDFNFSQIFTENRYLGNDRIGDANQLTLAVSSRLLDPRTGIERLRLGIGQRFYFADQRVVLPGEVPRQASSSDILAGAEGRITDAWLLSGLLQYNLDNNSIERFDAGVRWNPKPGAVLGGVWRYQRTLTDPVGNVTKLKQFDIAGQWPVAPRWTLLGRWNYSFVDSKTLEALAGVEYNADCWALRGVVHRLTTTSEQATTSFYLQLELAGLARVGNSPLDLLRRSIPGFLRSNDPLRTARDPGFDPYPEF